MAVYVCVEMEITNRPALEPYMVAVNDTIVKHGGRFLRASRSDQAHRRGAGAEDHCDR